MSFFSKEQLEKIRKKLEKEGLEKVRIKLANQEYCYRDQRLNPVVQAWIEKKELEIPKNANKIAKYAIGIAIISLLVSAFVAISK